MKMLEMRIDVDLDTVEIEGQRVVRPECISRSHWDEMWNKVNALIIRLKYDNSHHY